MREEEEGEEGGKEVYSLASQTLLRERLWEHFAY